MTPAAPSTPAEWREYEILARRHANGLGYDYNNPDLDELFGRLNVLATEFAPDFDPSRGCQFSTWMYGKLKLQLMTACREAAELAAGGHCTGFVDVDDSDPVAPDEYDESLLGVDLTDLQLPGGLTALVRQLLWASQGGASTAEMAVLLGVTERRVNQMLDQVLGGVERARTAGQGDFFPEGM